MSNELNSWSNYYGADAYLVGTIDENDFDPDQNDLAMALNVDPVDLFNRGFGTCWQEVTSFGLDNSWRWFAQGDPWNALMGMGVESVIVTGLDLSTIGLAGPGTLMAHKPQFHHEKSDLSGIHESILKVRKSMLRRWRRCENCQSPRLGGWCTCDSQILGICYD